MVEGERDAVVKCTGDKVRLLREFWSTITCTYMAYVMYHNGEYRSIRMDALTLMDNDVIDWRKNGF